MNDFNLLLTAALNEDFLNASMSYYDHPEIQKEIEDVENGLNSDMTAADIAL